MFISKTSMFRNTEFIELNLRSCLWEAMWYGPYLEVRWYVYFLSLSLSSMVLRTSEMLTPGSPCMIWFKSSSSITPSVSSSGGITEKGIKNSSWE